MTMDVRRLGPGDEAALEAFLRPRLASSMFLLSNMRQAGLVDTGARFSGTYAGAYEDGALVGVVAHYWLGNLIPQAPGCAGTLWRAAVAASGRPVLGVVGPADQAAAIIAALEAEAAAAGQALERRIDKVERLYTLPLEHMIVPEGLRSGRVVARRALEADLDAIAAFQVAFDVEALGEESSPELEAANRDASARGIAAGTVWVAEAGGVPVATTAFNAAIGEAVQVGGVYTPPALRGRGYARCAVAASLLAARDAGVALGVLFTGEDNVAAQRAYQALGFEHIGGWRLMLLREGFTLRM